MEKCIMQMFPSNPKQTSGPYLKRLTCWCPTLVLEHARGCAVLTLSTVLHAHSVCTADGLLVFRAGLDVHRLLGDGVLKTSGKHI